MKPKAVYDSRDLSLTITHHSARPAILVPRPSVVQEAKVRFVHGTVPCVVFTSGTGISEVKGIVQAILSKMVGKDFRIEDHAGEHGPYVKVTADITASKKKVEFFGPLSQSSRNPSVLPVLRNMRATGAIKKDDVYVWGEAVAFKNSFHLFFETCASLTKLAT